MRAIGIASALSASLALTACGSPSYPSKTSVEGPITQDADGVWIFQPAGRPRSVVVFLHGQGGPEETTPVNHRAWIDHLVERGSIVVYARYELAYERAALVHAVAGVRTAAERVDLDGLPALAIGYSRGAALAVEYGAKAPGANVPVPAAVLSVFPSPQGDQSTVVDLRTLPHRTKVVFMVGQEDDVVGAQGVRFFLRRLLVADFPPSRIRLRKVRSRGAFAAGHFAPMSTSAVARAAFWHPADRLLRELER